MTAHAFSPQVAHVARHEHSHGDAAVGAPPRHSLTSALAVAANALGLRRFGGHRAAPSTVQRRVVMTADAHGMPAQPLSVLTGTAPCAVARLVLLHGTPGSAAGWGSLLAAPPPGFEVLAPDRPGFGSSGPAHAVTSLEAQAAATAALLADDDRPTVLLGHSLGGAVAAQLAATRGERVHALVLLAAALDPDLERVHPLQRLGHWPAVRQCLPRAIRNANAELLALRSELSALAPRLAQIRCPVFIVHGTHDDLVPVANVRFAQRQFGTAARVLLLPGRNHFLPWNAEAELRRVIAAAGASACG